MPAPKQWPKIIEFLGHDPYGKPNTLGEHLFAERRALGFSKRKMAQKLGIDEATLRKLESGGYKKRHQRIREIIARLNERYGIIEE